MYGEWGFEMVYCGAPTVCGSKDFWRVLIGHVKVTHGALDCGMVIWE